MSFDSRRCRWQVLIGAFLLFLTSTGASIKATIAHCPWKEKVQMRGEGLGGNVSTSEAHEVHEEHEDQWEGRVRLAKRRRSV